AATPFEELLQQQRSQGNVPYAPFEDLAEWNLAEWLVTSGLTQSSIEKFLKLPIVSVSILMMSRRNTNAQLHLNDKTLRLSPWLCCCDFY
ncbi:hypothetical protein C2E23DRAFT_740105, partial [Lenzites betulinus]